MKIEITTETARQVEEALKQQVDLLDLKIAEIRKSKEKLYGILNQLQPLLKDK